MVTGPGTGAWMRRQRVHPSWRNEGIAYTGVKLTI